MHRLLVSLTFISLMVGCRSPYAGGALPNQAIPNSQFNAQGTKNLEIRLYRTYGNEGNLHVRGRVIKAENQRPESPDDSSLINFWRNLTSLSVKEIPGVSVDLTLNGRTHRLVSDHEGMVQAPLQVFGPLSPGFHTLQARLSPGQSYQAQSAEEQVVIQPQNTNTLGLVSDIDDTIKISNVTNKLKALRRLLFSNAYSVAPVSGTAVLYQILDQRFDGVQNNGDAHYLSGSPLNLARSIYTFMDFHKYPKGSVDLKKWGFSEGDDNPFKQENYKLERLRQLFQTYPQRSFYLFGDSGEKDPEIYRTIASEFPGQVKGIFINNINGKNPADPRFEGIHLTQNSTQQAQILQAQGLLSAEDVAAVARATEAYERFLQSENL